MKLRNRKFRFWDPVNQVFIEDPLGVLKTDKTFYFPVFRLGDINCIATELTDHIDLRGRGIFEGDILLTGSGKYQYVEYSIRLEKYICRLSEKSASIDIEPGFTVVGNIFQHRYLLDKNNDEYFTVTISRGNSIISTEVKSDLHLDYVTGELKRFMKEYDEN